jgi:hypothetical protein
MFNMPCVDQVYEAAPGMKLQLSADAVLLVGLLPEKPQHEQHYSH